MHDFSLHHRGAVSASTNFVPKAGELVSAKFSDGAWYRAKVRRSSPLKKEAEVTSSTTGTKILWPSRIFVLLIPSSDLYLVKLKMPA